MTNSRFANLVSTDAIKQAIVTYVAERAGVDQTDVEVDANLMTSGLLDSIGMMRLIAEVEEGLQVSVPPTDLVPENFKTISIMASYVQSLR